MEAWVLRNCKFAANPWRTWDRETDSIWHKVKRRTGVENKELDPNTVFTPKPADFKFVPKYPNSTAEWKSSRGGEWYIKNTRLPSLVEPFRNAGYNTAELEAISGPSPEPADPAAAEQGKELRVRRVDNDWSALKFKYDWNMVQAIKGVPHPVRPATHPTPGVA